jgi:nucleotide-binding universal stress UspA family protein
VTAPIVVGYDGSDASEAALGRAIEEASTSGGQLIVVTVAPIPLETVGPMPFGTLGEGYAPTLPPVEPADIEPTLEAAKARLAAAGVKADYVSEIGDPVAAIVREARDRDAAAIVVGHGHHTRFGRWLGTDIAAEVERNAGCRVIVVEP